MALNEIEQKEYESIGIKKKNLIHGAYYRGRCRNADIARWNGVKNQFYYVDDFIETIPGPEDEDGHDYFLPLEEIKAPDYQIPIEDFQE